MTPTQMIVGAMHCHRMNAISIKLKYKQCENRQQNLKKYATSFEGNLKKYPFSGRIGGCLSRNRALFTCQSNKSSSQAKEVELFVNLHCYDIIDR